MWVKRLKLRDDAVRPGHLVRVRARVRIRVRVTLRGRVRVRANPNPMRSGHQHQAPIVDVRVVERDPRTGLRRPTPIGMVPVPTKARLYARVLPHRLGVQVG